ncbi:Type III pantothenate kinase [Bordetella sputigena]|uniref:type III pantothenate kinase n=1 Tax=Bordetella sputigena TaxID=1416810 RepID=UPI0039EE1F99
MKNILLIDSGNTRLKVAVIAVGAAGSAGARTASTTAPAMAGDICAHAIDTNDVQGFNDWLAALPATPVAALGTNVAGPARAAGIQAALTRVGCPLRWVIPQARAHGLTSRYAKPEQLGADRWASMLGVMARLEGAPSGTPAPFLLASFGTATTIDTVSADGVFEGGLILPGPALMRSSLSTGTANLPLVQGDATAYPTDTQQAISSGVAAAQAGAVLRQWLAGIRLYGAPPRIYAAGGGWPEVETETRRLLEEAAASMGGLQTAITVIENPVLYGLARIAAAENLGLS